MLVKQPISALCCKVALTATRNAEGATLLMQAAEIGNLELVKH